MPTYFNRSRQVNRTPESEFRDACLKWLKLRFGPKMFHERNHQSMGSTPGRPDDQFLFKSSDRSDPIPVYIEFKSPTGRIGPRQLAYHEALRAMGARVYVVRTFDELEEAVADFQPSQLRMREVQK